METPVKQRSIRTMVLFLLSACLGFFALVLFGILYGTMPQMLRETESKYLADQIDITSGLLEDAIQNTYLMADDTGIWEETVRFANGENPDYLINNWPDASLLKAYSYDFVLIKDQDGNDLYTEYLNHLTGEHYPAPAGFSDFIDANLAQHVLAMYENAPPATSTIDELGQGGIFFLGDAQYFAATMPILPSRESTQPPAGTITLGNLLSDDYFGELTHFPTVQFDLLQDPTGQHQPEEINRLGDDYVRTSIHLEDIFGNPIVLLLTDTRTVYQRGLGAINIAALLLVASLLLFAVALYLTIKRTVLRPIEQLRKDMDTLGPDDRLSPDQYGKTLEFRALSNNINDTLGRLGESNNSLGILQHIVNGIDANIYVADPDTDEILFQNERMQRDYANRPSIGQPCYRALHGRDTRCDGCPIGQLQEDPTAVLEWETRSALGRYYRNTDSLIDWFGGRKARLELSVDITDSKLTAASLKRRLEQQALMTTITQSFISSANVGALIQDALCMTGTFMDASKIVISQVQADPSADPSADTSVIQFAYGWHNAAEQTGALQSTALPFRPGQEFYDAFVQEHKPYLAWDDLSQGEDFAFLRDFGVCSFISVPIMVGGSLWGVITVDECKGPREWSPSDIQLLRMVGGIFSGVLAREEAEKDLVRMSSLVETSPQFINYITHEGYFVYCNPGCQDILGYSAEELIGKSISLIMDAATYTHVKGSVLPEVIMHGRLDFEIPITRSDGAIRIMQFCSFATNLQPAGIGAIATDVTEQKRLERELIDAKELAESSSHAKSDFLSRMSHEMRTPMSAIIGMTNIAKGSNDPEKKEYCLDKIQDASNHLLGVINDILDMSKIEAKKFELSYTEFNFEKMLMRVVDVINFRVDEKKQNLIVKLDPAIPQYLICDEQRIAQVITNFLSNAVKFTPEQGTITLQANKVGEDGDYCIIQVEVIDTGIGISEAEQQKLFRAFEQGDGGISRRFGGTGLGLAISKSIIDLIGGDIAVHSAPDLGSTFSFTVSMQFGTYTPQRRLREGVHWDNLRVLVVDDSPDVLEYFQSIASSISLHCTVANSGEEAIALMEANRDTPFNIIFVDWKMPQMNGVELTRKIKTELNPDMVVIMISVAEWSEVEPEAREAGVDRFVPKPLFPSRIVDCINDCLGIPPQEEAPDEISVQDVAQFAGRRILLAEDIDINREIVIALLEHTGIQIDSAENGKRAVEMFSDAPGLYDMIFMDIHMPEMDGYEATRRIRALGIPEAQQVPIIAMTANVFREDVERCLAAGMNSHIGKPINIEDMFQKLRKYLPKE